jgi:hypothetical protein
MSSVKIFLVQNEDIKDICLALPRAAFALACLANRSINVEAACPDRTKLKNSEL